MAELLTTDQPKLASFLLSQAGKRFRWGASDCALFLADWLMLALDIPDPAITLRGKYDSEASCIALIGHGKFEDVMADLVDRIGLKRLNDGDQARDGDIGIIELPSTGPTGAIMTRGSWAFRSPHGFVWSKVPPGRVLVAWAVRHG